MDITSTRPTEFAKISSWFDAVAEAGRVDIYGISGYGGIGKSFLLRHVLDQKRPAKKGFLPLMVDGSNPAILGDMMAIFDQCLAPRSIPLGKESFDYFPRARRLSREHAKLARDVKDALEKTASPDDVKEAANWIFRGGSFLNKAVPKTREYIDFESLKKQGLDKRIEEAIDLLDRLRPLHVSSWVPGPIKDRIGVTR